MATFVSTAMMNKGKVSPIYYLRLLSLLICLTIVTLQSYSSDISEVTFRHFLTSSQDSLPPAGKDSARLQKDSTVHTTDSFHVPLSSDSLSAPVNYKAEDSMVLK
jgi:hypothetical protein